MQRTQSIDASVDSLAVSDAKKRSKTISTEGLLDPHSHGPPTSNMETMMHLFKGNVGTGCFAMADAVKNCGIVLGPILTVIIAIICVHVQHMLVTCAEYVKESHQLEQRPDYAETIELSFTSSPIEKWRKWGPTMKRTCNIFICTTQLGFCSVYYLFVGEHIKHVLDFYDIVIDINVMVALILVPILLTSLIRQLKYIAIFSTIANFCMIIGIILTIGYASQDLPSFSSRPYFASVYTLPLYFGTALFAFEGISLVLPLQNAMKTPEDFAKPFGVLNIGMIFVTGVYVAVGLVGYWKYGDTVKGSLTLNLPTEQVLAQVVMLLIAVGVALGYAIQFFVAIQIMLPNLTAKYQFAANHPILAETLFRTVMVLVTFTVAEIVPNLSLLLSLIGSVCCVVLAFVFPVLAQFIILKNKNLTISWWVWTKNSIILLIAVAGFVFGGGTSLKDAYKDISEKFQH